ncbi:MAG TPA: hypothetical protein VFT29_05270 [Gemmatimonadaceae bacterium]|nr:hypothetical protein [Gemmatimonadaceae bacterium]
MNRYMSMILTVGLAGMASACGSGQSRQTSQPLCSEAWYRAIESKVPTGDAQGHGPDIGSDEWKSAIEFKLGVRGQPNVPARTSDSWCQYIDRLVRERRSDSGRGGD